MTATRSTVPSGLGAGGVAIPPSERASILGRLALDPRREGGSDELPTDDPRRSFLGGSFSVMLSSDDSWPSPERALLGRWAARYIGEGGREDEGVDMGDGNVDSVNGVAGLGGETAPACLDSCSATAASAALVSLMIRGGDDERGFGVGAMGEPDMVGESGMDGCGV